MTSAIRSGSAAGGIVAIDSWARSNTHVDLGAAVAPMLGPDAARQHRVPPDAPRAVLVGDALHETDHAVFDVV